MFIAVTVECHTFHRERCYRLHDVRVGTNTIAEIIFFNATAPNAKRITKVGNYPNAPQRYELVISTNVGYCLKLSTKIFTKIDKM